MSSKRLGKYACLELERRYLLREVPPGLVESAKGLLIVDRYIVGTRLRLRRMTEPENGRTIHKFGQKYREAWQSDVETTMTNLYLNEREFACLSELEAWEIVKRRYRYVDGGLEYGIDVFEGVLSGLILAEIECESEQECEGLEVPSFALREVTGDIFFTGGHLARLTREEFEAVWVKRLYQK